MQQDKRKSKKTTTELVQSFNIAETMNECLWVGDKNHKTLYVNPIFEELSGRSLKECQGKDCGFFFDKETRKVIKDHHVLRPEGLSSQYEGTMLSKKGKKIPLLISGAPTKSGGTIGVFTNLTLLKKLAEKEQIAQQIVKNSSEAIIVLNKSFEIKMWNRGAEKMFGYKENEVLGNSIDIIKPHKGDDDKLRITEEFKRKGHIQGAEKQRITKNGTLIDVSFSMTKVKDKNRKFIGYLVIYTDITIQRKAKEELQRRFDTIQDAYKELGIERRKNDYFTEVVNLAISGAPIEEVANFIISATKMITKCNGVVLRLYDKKTNSLIIKECTGVDAQWWSKSKVPLKDSLAEDAFRKKRPLIINDIIHEPKHRGQKLVRTHGFTTLILAPLYANEEKIGTLSLYSTDPSKMQYIETDLLENFSKLCALALKAKL